ncbi:MAG TPA: hypothetical protein DCY91_23270 [Cyanobacteria bacterium UBA11370]|nr:hypothetical protein [Cyanobacteria bacterium UBA11370]
MQPQRSYQPEPIEQETVRIEDQLERASKFGYNGLDVPVNAPATPPPPVQRQSDSGGSENNSQSPVAEASATSETVEETVSREELFEEETPPNQESPDTEGEGESVPETVQPEAETREQQPQKPFLQAQLEKASRFGYNGLDVPVNTPGTPSPRVQRKLTLDGLDNEYQPEMIERANPVLNGLNQFKVQQLGQIQRVEYPPIASEDPIQKKEMADGSEMNSAPPLKEAIVQKRGNGQAVEPLEAKTLDKQTTEFTKNKEPQRTVGEAEAGASAPVEAKKLGDRFREVHPEPKNTQSSNVDNLSPKTISQISTSASNQTPPTDSSKAVKENQLAEAATEKQKEQKAEAPASSQVGKSESPSSSESLPTQPPAQSAATTPTGKASGSSGVAPGQTSASVPQQAVAISAEDPAMILAHLKTTPPTQAVATYAIAQTASTQALEKQRLSLQKTIPELPAPTGLPAQPGTESMKAAQQAVEQAGATKEVPDAKGYSR